MNKILFYVVLLFVIGGLFTSCKQTKTKSEILSKSIDSLLVSNKEKLFNGIILIAKNGKTEYLKMKGFSDFGEKTPFKINDRFVVGSVSKQFTAAIILREYDNRRLDLHVPIRKYLPDMLENWADTVTTHHLLTHTHGIISLDKPTLFPVGTQYDYSQIGYDLLAKIAEKVSGKSFPELSNELFEICKMENTFHPEKSAGKNLVKGYIENNEGKLEYTDESLNQYPAAGTFISSAEDLVLWNQLFFEGQFLKNNSFKYMTTKQDKAIRNHPIFGITEYGYGITVNDNDGIIQWGQTGYAPGFASMNFYFPQKKISVIVLENIIYDTDDIMKTYHYHVQILNLVRDIVLK